ncbi:MAG: hypothetical protein RLO17_18765 [Cyclobacteriaceae bacterium]
MAIYLKPILNKAHGILIKVYCTSTKVSAIQLKSMIRGQCPSPQSLGCDE